MNLEIITEEIFHCYLLLLRQAVIFDCKTFKNKLPLIPLGNVSESTETVNGDMSYLIWKQSPLSFVSHTNPFSLVSQKDPPNGSLTEPSLLYMPGISNYKKTKTGPKHTFSDIT